MRIGRIQDRDGGPPIDVVIEGDVAFRMTGSPFGSVQKGEELGPVANVSLLPPLAPGKIVCVGLNYRAHVTENDPTRQIPDEPVIFMKPPSALIGHGDTIIIANPGNRTDYEAELAVVIGKETRSVSESSARDYVLGFTCGNDVSDRVLQKKDGQWVRAKGFDTYCPLGPWIETDLDIDSAVVSSAVNGVERQSQGVSTMLFPVPFLISFISGIMTLHPGDVIMTGTPEGVGPLHAGDTVVVSVTGIGSLSNTVQ
ncbi:MAG: fumarylacetoacetate hydrolase family protein [Thermomicrobiales bacterium]